MHGVGIDGLGEVGTNGARVRIFRVGGTHQLPVAGNGVLAFQHLHHDRAGGHELDQRGEERTLAVLGVETTGNGVAQAQHFCRHHAQARGLEP